MSSSVKYYDGKSSKPQPAKVETLGSEGMRITLIETSESFIWKYKDCDVLSLSSGDKVQISNGKENQQMIVLDETEYPELMDHLMYTQSEISNIYQRLKTYSPLKIFGFGLIIMITLSFFYIVVVSPWVGERIAVLVPKSMEIMLGKSVANNLINYSEVDEEKSNLLNQFFELCEFESDYPIQLTYLDSDVTNAMAAPGGQIIVYDGIVELTDNYEELAGLLAHELAHVNERHSLIALARASSSFLVLSAITGDVAGISGVLMEQAKQLHELANSRSAEKEADELGLYYLSKSQINPQGMVGLFDALKRASPKVFSDSTSVMREVENIDFFSTHPATEKRIDNLSDRIKEMNVDVVYRPRLDSLWLLMKHE